MDKDKIFFGDSGLTSTSANHIANVAKEAYLEIEKSLNDFVLYTKSVSLISSYMTKLVREGVNEDYIKGFEAKLEEVAQYKSLIAWLREAIKAKETLCGEMQVKDKEEIAKSLGLKYPEAPLLENAERVMNEDDYWATKNVKERNRFFELETQCAVIGKFIHPEGSFSEQRNALYKAICCPNEVVGTGRDALLYTSEPSVSTDVVEEYYFALQKKYRALQAELNKIRHDITLAIEEDKSRYHSEREALIGKYNKERAEYNARVEEIDNQVSAYRQKELARISALKIVIPDSLKTIYQKINKK